MKIKEIFNKDKKGAAGAGLLVAILLIAISMVGVVGFFGYQLTQQTAAVPPVPEGEQPSRTSTGALVGCFQTDPVTVTVNSFDIQDTGTATGETHSVWVKRNGETDYSFLQTVANAGTFSASPGDMLMILYGNNSESIDVGFYPEMRKDIQVPCTPTFLAKALQKDKNSTAVTTSFFNEDDGLINSGTDANAVDVNGQSVVKMTIRTSAEDYFGYDKSVVVFDASSNAFDEVSISGATKTTTPSQHTAVAGSRAYAWEIPGLVGSEMKTYSVLLDAGGTEPTVAHNVTVTVYDNSWFLDQNTNLPVLAYENETNGNIGSNNDVSTLFIS